MNIPLDGSNFDTLKWIWKNLIPKSGQSEWVQGELLRAIEKLRWEAQNNGNINWDDRFIMLLDYIENILTSEIKMEKSTIESVKQDLKRLREFDTPNTPDFDFDRLPYVEDDLYDRLGNALVEYCKINPQLFKNESNPEQYR
ncbi:MAG: hypothetical protein F9K24_18615 [Leptonema illini]|jgi:hypothetical protein|uniref:Uncharacterized protein n=1 Tax=Leptonema illini TaxID=183 RepID=A0A833GYF5_9LEPT|nr:MAG: hypothetical protein F9K24_18615 [Leptonema illini]